MYTDFLYIHKNIYFSFQLGVSQDFGTYNVEMMNCPRNVENCKVRLKLFAIIPNEDTIQANSGDIIGTVIGCANTFKPNLGDLYRIKKYEIY